MKKIKIMSDSTCDLSDELIEKYNITILPLTIILDDKSYNDRIDIKPKDVYKWSDSTGRTPKTAAVNLNTAIEALKKYDAKDTDIIVFAISELMSSTCNVFRLASEELINARVYVINSMNLSTGMGIQVIKAAKLAQQNMKADEIVAEIERTRNLVYSGFIIDTLDYLHRGGRCSTLAAICGSTLKIKPRIAVVNGKMEVIKKYRGNTASIINKYMHDIECSLLTADSDMVFITHSGCSDNVVNEVYTFINNLNYFNEIYITEAGSVISSHCGPNTLGVLFYSK